MAARPPKLPPAATRAIARIRRDLYALDVMLEDDDLSFEQVARLYGELDRAGDHDPPGITQCAAAVRDRARVVCRALYPWPADARQVTVPGVGTIAPSKSGGATRWDGPALASKLAARVADEGYDSETGSMKPLGVVCNEVAQELVACAGLDTQSQTWRAGALEERNIDPDTYRDKSGGTPSVRFTD